MPTPTYDLLASQTLGSNTTSVTFSSLSSSYRDIVIVFNGGRTNYSGIYNIRFNGDSGANYSRVGLTTNGSQNISGATSGANRLDFSWGYAVQNPTYLAITQIFDASASDKHKTILSRNNDGATGVDVYAGRWANTSAITSIEIFTNNTDGYTTGTIYLYGIVS